MNWKNAHNHCKSKGGKLVEIDSEEENTALVEEIKRREYTQKKMIFWIGLTDLGSEGDWRLASSGLKPSYEKWHEGEPNNGYGNEDCASIGWIGWRDTWSDIICNQLGGGPDKLYTYSTLGQDKLDNEKEIGSQTKLLLRACTNCSGVVENVSRHCNNFIVSEEKNYLVAKCYNMVFSVAKMPFTRCVLKKMKNLRCESTPPQFILTCSMHPLCEFSHSTDQPTARNHIKEGWLI